MAQILTLVLSVRACSCRTAGAKLWFAVLLVGTATLPAMAWEQGTPEARQACTPDVFRLCNEFIPDPGRITLCLQQKVSDLSPSCRIVMDGPARRAERGR